MVISPDELEKEGYHPIASLSHQELIPFVKDNLNRNTKSSIIYRFSNYLLLLSLVAFSTYSIINQNLSFGLCLTQFSIGVLIAILLIPIHEIIHAIAYRIVGAKKVSFGAEVRKFYFMALADKFVANRSEFRIVALSPFVTISILSFTLLFIVSVPWQITAISSWLTHTAFCSGDFGLLSFFEYHKEKEMVTYDDVQNKISYFLAK